MGKSTASINIVDRFNDYWNGPPNDSTTTTTTTTTTPLTSLAKWQRLCRDLGLEEGTFTSKTQCRKAIAKIHVNIHDFIEAVHAGVSFQQSTLTANWPWPSTTRKTKKVYPRAQAKASEPLKVLLRYIMHPRGGKKKKKKKKKKKGGR
ncbi:hypothetical protein B0T19DRAFT_437899 [Cercophora scortea]|uniref:Uncharacterized protein n=1 Tax=Cercophora scortea TaxID=314031 RepID=A0AAE0J5A1_9PEZI|nr:hypothetical protein B0T19DRAFT_437899 [Cercophora scortea]